MNNTISLVESRTFWASLLALVAVIAGAFNQAGLMTWASDPATLNAITSGVAMIGAVGAIYFRKAATAQVTSVLPPSK